MYKQVQMILSKYEGSDHYLSKVNICLMENNKLVLFDLNSLDLSLLTNESITTNRYLMGAKTKDLCIKSYFRSLDEISAEENQFNREQQLYYSLTKFTFVLYMLFLAHKKHETESRKKRVPRGQEVENKYTIKNSHFLQLCFKLCFLFQNQQNPFVKYIFALFQ